MNQQPLSDWCPFLSRRDLLRVGALGVAGSFLPSLAQSATKPKSVQSVIVLWMAGGMTHHDSFDPKPDAPEEIRGTLSAIRTKLPGVQFCETMPNLAHIADKLAVIRTFASGNNDHFRSQAYALSGRDVTRTQITTEPNVGCLVSKLLGGRNGFPGYITVPGTTRPGPPGKNLFVPGWLGQEHAPFSSGGKPRNEDFTQGVKEADEEELNRQSLMLAPGTDAKRVTGRRTLRRRLDQALGDLEQAQNAGALDRQFQSAFDMLLSPRVRRAFDLRKESTKIRETYGQTKIGQRCLLARRLVDAGARFVLVDYGYDPEYGNLWDNHNAPSQNFPHISKMAKLPYHVAGVDRAFAALLNDLDTRGRLDQTLVVLLTEFGRTPKINKRGGRDHWGKTGSIFFAGGGAKVGQVIGKTDKQGGEPATRSYSPADVAATIYHFLGISPETMVQDIQGRPLPVLPDGSAITEVIG